MATTCCVCLRKRKTSESFVWCSDCYNLLCQSCSVEHNKSEETKTHDVMSYADYQQLPPFILTNKNYCQSHKQKIFKYCRGHDEPICEKCQKEFHSKCKDVQVIEDIVCNVKASAIFDEVLTEIVTTCATLKNISEDRHKNLKELKSMRKQINESIDKKVDHLMKYLKQLKEKAISKVESVFFELENDISQTSKSVEIRNHELRDILNQSENIRKYATNCQFFLGMKRMETLVHETRISIQKLVEEGKLAHHTLTFDMKTVEDYLCSTHSLGILKVTKSAPTVPISFTRPAAAQKQVYTLDAMQLSLQQTIDLNEDGKKVEKGWFYGCCTLPSGLLLTDFSNNKLCIYNLEGSIRSTVRFSGKQGIYGVTPVNYQHVAVSHPVSNGISIINIENGEVVKTLNTIDSVRGLCCRERDLLCCVKEKGIVKVNIDDENVVTVVEDTNVIGDSNLKVSNKSMCYTCPGANTVIVLDAQYNVVFTYKDETVLKYPIGVTIDEQKNIYVVGIYSNNLVVISSDGRYCRQLLGKDDRLDSPSALHYESSTKELIVVNFNGPVFIYSLGFKR